MNMKKSQGLPINVVVMMIIGVIIFSIGMTLFSKATQSGEDIIEDLNSQIQTDIANLECDGGEWICAGSYVLKDKKGLLNVIISNHGKEIDDFGIQLNLLNEAPKTELHIENNNCGAIIIYHPTNKVEIESGGSAKFPLAIVDDRVVKRPCSFTAIASLDTTGEGKDESTPIIIRVE